MTDSAPQPNLSDDAQRQRRLEALRDLAHGADASQTSAPPAAVATGVMVALKPMPRRGRRIALVGAVAALALIGVVGLFARGALTARSSDHIGPSTLRSRVITLPASASLYCPSTPAWSPDGKYIAVMAQTLEPGDQGHCPFYGDIVSANLLQEYSFSFPGWSTVMVVIDASTGAILRRILVPDPDPALCADASHCSIGLAMPTSLSWSPDGASIAVYTDQDIDYYTSSGQEFNQHRAVLDIMRADGSGLRTLVARGRDQATTNDIKTANLYSPPLFEWDLSDGAGSFTDMREAAGEFTVSYAPAYQLSADGKISALTAHTPNTASPWRHGALQLDSNVHNPDPNVQLVGSQWAWSSDGRYVIPNLVTDAYLNVPQVTYNPGAVMMQGMYQPPFVAPPNVAASAAVRDVVWARAGIYLALDPYGKRLASFACQQDGDTGLLTVRASGAAQPVAISVYSFPLVGTSLACPGDVTPIVWSPDGSRIAMSDIQDGQIVMWQAPSAQV